MAIWNEELLDKEENIYKEAHLQKYWLKQKEIRELDDAVLYLTASHQSKEFLA